MVAAAFVLAAALASAPLSGAADTANKQVTLTITPSVDVSFASCPPTAGQLTLYRSGAAAKAPTECMINFSTSNGSSARLRATDTNDAWSMQAPSLLTIPDLPFGAASTLPAAGGGIGLCLAAVTNAASSMTMQPGCATTALGWYGLRQSSPQQIAMTSGNVNGIAHVWLGGSVPVGQGAGNYAGTITFEVVSP
jgi:hypothetical protein